MELGIDEETAEMEVLLLQQTENCKPYLGVSRLALKD